MYMLSVRMHTQDAEDDDSLNRALRVRVHALQIWQPMSRVVLVSAIMLSPHLSSGPVLIMYGPVYGPIFIYSVWSRLWSHIDPVWSRMGPELLSTFILSWTVAPAHRCDRRCEHMMQLEHPMQKGFRALLHVTGARAACTWNTYAQDSGVYRISRQLVFVVFGELRRYLFSYSISIKL